LLKRSNETNNLSNIVQTCECCIAVLVGHENVGVSRAYERGFQQVHRSGARKAKKGPANLWRANFTSNTLLHYLIMFVTTLYIKYMLSANWTFCCTGNKAFIKVYQWFYWTSNPQFWEKFQPIPGAAKQSCSALHHFSWRPRMWEFLLTSLNDGQTTSVIMSHSICKVLIFEHYNIQILIFMSIYKHVQSQFFSYWNNWCGLTMGHVFHKFKDLLKGS
jgi:hypothetical protein